jgi:hypothetical protein
LHNLTTQVEAFQRQTSLELIRIVELQRSTAVELAATREQLSELLRRASPPRTSSVYAPHIDPVTGLVRIKPIDLPRAGPNPAPAAAAQPPVASMTPQETVEAVMRELQARQQVGTTVSTAVTPNVSTSPPQPVPTPVITGSVVTQPSLPSTTLHGIPASVGKRGRLKKLILKLLTRGR